MDDGSTSKLVAQFLQWEQASRDTIDFKKSYVDMAGDLIAGLVLSQIVYWHLPGANGITRLRVSRDNELWIAKARKDWYDEIRVSPKQLDRALLILEKHNLIATAVYHFAGFPTKHIRLEWDNFLDQFKFSILPKGENSEATKFPKGKNGYSPKVKMDIDQRGISLTENTTENTTKESLTPSASDTSIPSLPKPAKPAPKPAKSVSRKELPTDVFFNALADDFYGGMRKGNSMVGRALFGKKGGYLGIIVHEMERQHKTREQLDYNALALMSPKFKAWFNQQHDKPLTLRDPEKLIGWWETWRNTTNHVNCPPVIFYNPDCPHKADPEPCEEGWILTTKPDGERVRIPCECQMKIRKEKGLPW